MQRTNLVFFGHSQTVSKHPQTGRYCFLQAQPGIYYCHSTCQATEFMNWLFWGRVQHRKVAVGWYTRGGYMMLWVFVKAQLWTTVIYKIYNYRISGDLNLCRRSSQRKKIHPEYLCNFSLPGFLIVALNKSTPGVQRVYSLIPACTEVSVRCVCLDISVLTYVWMRRVCMHGRHSAFFSSSMTGECKNMTPSEWKPSAPLVMRLCSVRVFTLRLHAWKKTNQQGFINQFPLQAPRVYSTHSAMLIDDEMSDRWSGRQPKCSAHMQKLLNLRVVSCVVAPFGYFWMEMSCSLCSMFKLAPRTLTISVLSFLFGWNVINISSERMKFQLCSCGVQLQSEQGKSAWVPPPRMVHPSHSTQADRLDLSWIQHRDLQH